MLTVAETIARFKTGRSWTDEDIANLKEYCKYNLRQTLDNVDEHIERIARHSGTYWYLDANDESLSFSVTHGITDMAASSIIAVYSRNNAWLQNLKDARQFLNGNYERGMKAVWSRAQTLLALDSGLWQDYYAVVMGASAYKESAFADNIMYPHSSIRVTLDRWMFRAMGIEAALSLKFEHWLELESIFTELASEYGFSHGHQLQAYAWIIVREGRVV